MRLFLQLLFTAILGLAAAGCSPAKQANQLSSSISRGHGEADEAWRRAYIGFLCDKAGLAVTSPDGVHRCHPSRFAAKDWHLLLQTGLTDIDRRCDAYLAWQEDATQSSGGAPQMFKGAALSNGLLQPEDRGPGGLLAVSQALDASPPLLAPAPSGARILAPSELAELRRNSQERRAMERAKLDKRRISDMNAVLIRLSSFLAACAPTNASPRGKIASSAKKTRMKIAQTEKSQPAIAPAIAKPVQPAVAKEAHQPSNLAQKETPPPALPPAVMQAAAPSNYRAILASAPSNYTVNAVNRALRAICVPASELGMVTPRTAALIRNFETQYHRRQEGPSVDGRLDIPEIPYLAGYAPCNTALHRNFYERSMSDKAVANFISKLRALPHGATLPENARLSDAHVRAAILDVKAANSFGGDSSALRDQVTPEFLDCLDNGQCKK